MGNNYFKETVLPSVNLPYKASYSIPETRNIMGCSKSTLWRMNVRKELVIAPNKKIYCRDLEEYFNNDHMPKTRMKT